MAPLPSVASTPGPRARRWDAVVLGSGAVALMTAVRLGMAGHRVLVVEEAARRDAFPGVREPFFLAGTRDRGVLDAIMRAISVPLIDRRRIAPSETAFQIVAPDLRAEVGEAGLTARELATWRLLPHEQARTFTHALRDASEAERQAILESPLVRLGKRGGRRSTAQGAHLRGLPADASSAQGSLAHFLDVQVRALSNLADASPSPEAKARLLGGVQAGGASFEEGPPWFMELLRRRVESSFGEFRTPPGAFSLVAAGQQPGLALADSEDLWLGRALIVATPAAPLAKVLAQDPIPEFLQSKRRLKRRIAAHFQCPRSLLPEGMGTRLILTGDPQAAPKGPDPVSLSVFATSSGEDRVDLVARGIFDPADDLEAAEQALEEKVRELICFAGSDLQRSAVQHPRWDDDGWLENPESGSGWPAELQLRVSSRPPVYRLDRAEVAGLGVEGDLLLGWRAGDAIAGEL
jgi:hypothetical protein